MHPIPSRRISANLLVFGVALLLATAANINFWSGFIHAIGGFSLARLPLLAGSFAIVVLLFYLVLADWLYQRSAAAFPWREAWLTTTFGHGILKAELTLPAACFVAAAIVDAVRPQALLARPLPAGRPRLERVVAGVAGGGVAAGAGPPGRARLLRGAGTRTGPGVDAADARCPFPHAHAVVGLDRLCDRTGARDAAAG
ncbi:hypothetical protein JN27_13970 [Massilia sp. BSC265]|nr:hypothetical protein [Massilia sp. BSC265]KFI06776.1 hypothetical protein JN27_13970 [Massilia sp. BSC265]